MFLQKSREAFNNLPASQQQKWFVRGYFLVLLLVGLFIYKDYGVSWDESIDRVNGIVNAKYMVDQFAPYWAADQKAFANVPDFYSHSEVDHGALFHLPLAFIEVVAGGLDSRTYYLVRHFAIFLTFVLGAWALYKLALIRFGSWQLGLLASTLLVLSPRLFADGFYNGKDLVFMAFFTLAIYSLVRLLEQPTFGRAILHGLATAAATDMRILGCMLVALTIGMLALEAIFGSAGNKPRGLLLRAFVVYCAATVLFTIAGWPYLWEMPGFSFLQAFDNMQRFRWDGALLYMGDVIMGTNLPWHYTPVWIIVSTPVAYILAFVVGALAYVYSLLRRGTGALRTFSGRLDILFSGWFTLPILMVVMLHSVIYDGWRHLYFVYPALLLLAVRGMYVVWQASRPYLAARRVALVLGLLVAAEGVFTLGRMVKSHPHQQVYYSFLSSAAAEQLFERDYWGLSFRQGLEWVLAHDDSPSIPVDCGQFLILLENNISVLKPQDRARLRISSNDPKAYYFAGYRTHPEAYPDTIGREVHTVHSNGIKILSIHHR